MTLLVDGIRTLRQRRKRPAKAWALPPSDNSIKPKIHAFEGWYVPDRWDASCGEKIDFNIKRFEFVNLSESVAARTNYGDSIGLITATFYWQRGRDLAVGE